MDNTCASLACNGTATHTVSWTDPAERRCVTYTDDVCVECAGSYLRRPRLQASVRPMASAMEERIISRAVQLMRAGH